MTDKAFVQSHRPGTACRRSPTRRVYHVWFGANTLAAEARTPMEAWRWARLAVEAEMGSGRRHTVYRGRLAPV